MKTQDIFKKISRPQHFRYTSAMLIVKINIHKQLFQMNFYFSIIVLYQL